eukprot:6203868-Pleurochrysis_carterae.AAC.1
MLLLLFEGTGFEKHWARAHSRRVAHALHLLAPSHFAEVAPLAFAAQVFGPLMVLAVKNDEGNLAK